MLFGVDRLLKKSDDQGFLVVEKLKIGPINAWQVLKNTHQPVRGLPQGD